jgi:hypothetical protein
MVSTIPAIPGSVSVAPIRRQDPEDQPHVQDQRDGGEHPEQPVAQHHEDQHGGEGHERGEFARRDAVGAQFRPDGAFFEEGHLGGQRARAQQDRQLGRAFHREIARDLPRPAR